MDGFGWEADHPKKRRRRNKPNNPQSTRLIFDDKVRGDAGVLSDDLWTSLFPSQSIPDDERATENVTESPTHLHVAISPSTVWTAFQEDIGWTIIPARRPNPQELETGSFPPSTIYLPSNSSGGRHFLRTLQVLEPNRNASHHHNPFEIRAIDVRPLSLDTVYITVEKNLLNNVDDVQSRFGGGFQSSGINGTYGATRKSVVHGDSTKRQSHDSSTALESRLTSIVRSGLSELPVVHSGEVFPLPLPAHPITHVPPPPAVVAYTEPVLQGTLSAKTKIVLINAASSRAKALANPKPIRPAVQEVIDVESEDTSNEHFYSAAEERQSEESSEIDSLSGDDNSETEKSSQTYSDDASDDSLDDVISLSVPSLASQESVAASAFTSATPRPGKGTGAISPGSIYSNFTSRTARAGSQSGKLFKTEALLQRISNEALHPRPSQEDDNDSFVFVDITALAKIGCFSGDWVRVDIVNDTIVALTLPGYQGSAEESQDSRVVRVFGLSGLSKGKHLYAVDRSGDNKSGFSQSQSYTHTPSVFIPPVLLSNLGDPKFVKLISLSKRPEIPASRSLTSQAKSDAQFSPPVAKEIKLLKLSTPLATSRDVQSALFAGLKRHFESKRRLLKAGDLVAIPIDEELGKATFSPVVAAEPGGGNEQLIHQMSPSLESSAVRVGVAWFSVDQIIMDTQPESVEDHGHESWGGVAVIHSLSTRIAQAGTTIRSLPKQVEQNWQCWAGRRKAVASQTVRPLVPITASNVQLPSVSPLQKRLSDLMIAATSPRAINLRLPPLFILLHSTQRQTGKSYNARAASTLAGLQIFPISAHDILSEGSSPNGGGDVQTEALLKARAERAITCGPEYTTILLQHIEVLTADRIVPALRDILKDARLMIATTTEIDKISDGIRSLFTHEFEMAAPNESERESILRNVCLEHSIRLDPLANLKSVALKTAALVAGDLVDVVDRATIARSLRLEKLATNQSVNLSDVYLSGGPFVTNTLAEDFTTAISYARSTFSDSIGAPKIPSVTWKDVGGLADQKSSIMETISLPLARPELFARGMRKRSGILFYGPPGTGKTLLAKAIATEFSLNFFSVKGPELLNMYIGESEANVRRVFQRARDARPCVVFFDELDSVAPKRGNQGDSGGVMDRIVSQLLAELDGMSSGGGASGDDNDGAGGGNAGGVFVIGATNRPDLLDPALLRPGRFDKMLYLGVSSTHEQQVTILEALTRKFSLASDVDLRRVAQRLPFTYTGADLYALCSDAMLKAITRKTKIVDEKVIEANKGRKEAISTAYFFDHLAKPEDTEVVVSEEDFGAAQRELVASVSAKELAHFERIRDQFEQQDVSKSSATASTDPERQSQTNPKHIQSSANTLPIRQMQNQNFAKRPPPPVFPQPSSARRNSETTVGPTSNISKLKGKGIANPDSRPDSGDDDDYIIRTSHLNGSLNGGKGKAQQYDGFIDGEDEELYA